MVFDFKLLIPFAVTYGIVLLIAFQLGFFTVVGFQFSGLVGAIDIWANFGIIIGCSAAIVAVLLVLLISFQISEQSGFDVVRWIAGRGAAIATILAFLSALIMAWLWYKKQPFQMLLLMVLPLLVEITVTYCNAISYQRIMMWSAILSFVYAVAFSYFIGLYSGYYNLVIEARRYDILFDGHKIEGVKLIRASGSGIIFAKDLDMTFANISKIISITPSK